MTPSLSLRAPEREKLVVRAFRLPSRPAAAAARSGPRAPTGERLGAAAASAWFLVLAGGCAQGLARLVSDLPASGGALALAPVVSRGCTLFFLLALGWLMLVRPKASVATPGTAPKLVALVGTYAVWLTPFLPQAQISPALAMVSAAMTLVGSVSVVAAIARLGRSFSIAPQARRLVTTGPYRLVRHPLYLAEEIALVGILLQCAWYLAAVFFLAHVSLQIARMTYEEALLKRAFPEYEAYARRTARLLPGLW